MSYVALWGRAFVLTWATESLVALSWRGMTADAGAPSRARLLVAVFFAQLTTHPVVWFVVPRLWLPGWGSLALAETFAVLCELAFYRLVFPHAGAAPLAALSLAANVASWGLGHALLG